VVTGNVQLLMADTAKYISRVWNEVFLGLGLFDMPEVDVGADERRISDRKRFLVRSEGCSRYTNLSLRHKIICISSTLTPYLGKLLNCQEIDIL
jgi:hypothetical protein